MEDEASSKELVLRVSADITRMRFTKRSTQKVQHGTGDDFVNVDAPI